MNPDYSISSDGFLVDNLRDVLENLVEVTDALQLGFFVIGAIARDIFIHQIHGLQPQRATGDLDIAISLDEWDDFTELRESLVDRYKYKRSRTQHQLISPQAIQLDILPFGGLEDPRGVIEWPEDDGFQFSTVGFREAFEVAKTVALDGETEFKVAPLPAIALLKLIAWSDDRRRRQKDAQDLCQLMRSYADVLGTEFYIVHQDIVDDPDFDADIGSARALGRDVGSILVDSNDVAKTIAAILERQTAGSESQLALDMGPECHPDYELRYGCLVGFRTGFLETLT